MKYTEMLELYKQGGLDAVQKDRIEEDIERQKAIGAYIGETEKQSNDEKHSTREAKESKEFIKLIRSRTRRSMITFSIVMLMLIALLGAGTVWLLYQMPKWENENYYDPIGEGQQLQLEKDMMY